MTDPARLLDLELDGSCRRAMNAAMTEEPPPGAKAELWRSISLALPSAGVLLGATTVAKSVEAATAGASIGTATGAVAPAGIGTATGAVAPAGIAAATGTVAPAGIAAATGTAVSALGSSGLGIIAGKAVAIGLGIGLAANVASTVLIRGINTSPVASAESQRPVLAKPIVAPPTFAKPALVQRTLAKPAEQAVAEPRAMPIAPPTAENLEAVVLPAREVDAAQPSSSEGAAGDELRAESALLVRTREALVAKKPQSALELLGQHRQRYPGGKLAQERDALEIQAWVNAGDTGQGEEARRFLLRYPDSPHAAKIRGSLGLE